MKQSFKQTSREFVAVECAWSGVLKVLLGIFVAVALYFVGSLFLLHTMYPDQTYRYRLSISPEIDGQVRKASSVIEVTAEESPFGGGGATLRGQAPYLDLGERGVLIFSLGNDYDNDNARAALWLGAKAFGNDSSIPEIYKLPRLTGRRDLPPDLIPVAVWFSTPGDLTVRRALLPQDFAGAFGPGAQIASANVEITRDPVVIDIDKKLPSWLSPLTAKNTGLVISGSDWAAPTNLRRHHLLRNDEDSPSFIVRLFAAGVVLPFMPFWSKRASCPHCQRR